MDGSERDNKIFRRDKMEKWKHSGRWALLISLGSHAALLWFWPQWDSAASQPPLPQHGAALARLQVRLLAPPPEKEIQAQPRSNSRARPTPLRPARRAPIVPRAIIATTDARATDIVSSPTAPLLESRPGAALVVEALREHWRG